MAGNGPAPKDPALRRNKSAPKRGDWIDLPPLEGPVLPELPDRNWSERTQAVWAAWRQDPATAMFGPGEIEFAIDLGYAHTEWVEQGGAERLKQIRLMMDTLGLTPKGKQDRRWRIPAEVPTEDVKPAKTSGNVIDIQDRLAQEAV